MSDFREYLNEQMQDEEFKSEYEKLETEFSVIQAVIDAEKEQPAYTEGVIGKNGDGRSPIYRSWKTATAIPQSIC